MSSPSFRLVVLDGHSLAYRAFYGMPALTTRAGRPVHAVLGFTTMLLKVVETEKPTHLAVSFDRGLPTVRLESYAEYKAGREKMPDDLVAQLPVIEQMVRTMGIPVFTSEEHEADDCIGTLARRAEAEGFEVVLVSGDHDLLQLVDEHVRVMATVRGLTETTRYDVKGVQERYGFAPELIPDFKALAGDPSDHIPGVSGIGKGTATKLITEYGGVESILARLDEVPARWRDRIRAQVDDVACFRQLATIRTDLPLEVSWDECRWNGVPAPAVDLMLELEFRRLVERLGLTPTTESREAEPADAGTAATVEEVVDEEGLARLAAACQGAPSVGLAWMREGDCTVALAVSLDPSHAYVIPVDTPAEGTLPFAGGGLSRDAVRGLLLPVLGREGRTAWAFDLKAAMVEWGLEHFPREAALHDVGVASYLLESGMSQKSLQAIAGRHGVLAPPEAESVFGKGARSVSWADVDPARRNAFAGQAAATTLALSHVLWGQLAGGELERLFLEVDMPLVRILAEMEDAGVGLDVARLRHLGLEMERDLEQIRRRVIEAVGFEFNLNSPRQLGEILFERLRLPGGKKTKTGAWTTDADVLAGLVDQHPVCGLIMEHRELIKLKSTYVDALPQLVDPWDGRLHTSWNVTVAATGRLSSSDPNLQNIPVRTEMGRRIREAFVVGRPGCVLLSADYSQIELRIMAHVSRDEHLVRAFREGEDVHRATAAQIFGVPPEDVTSDMRRKAKEVNFGIMYGMGPEGLSARINVTRREARAYIDAYLESFPGVRRYTEETVKGAEERGYVATLLGRRRHLPEINDRNRMVRAAAARMAVNAPIQGTAADLVKRAMVLLEALIHPPQEGQGGALPARMLLQVHDELIFEVAECDLVPVAAVVKRVMEEALPLDVPVRVDLKSGSDWASMRPLEVPEAATAS